MTTINQVQEMRLRIQRLSEYHAEAVKNCDSHDMNIRSADLWQAQLDMRRITKARKAKLINA